ncbi:aspartate kinase [bacterium]
MIVAKFGGGAMSTSKTVKKVIEMILHDRKRRIIVVSAPGKRPEVAGDTKVTDLLIACSESKDKPRKLKGLVGDIAGRYREIARGLGLDEGIAAEFDEIIEKRISKKDKNYLRYMDGVKALGEETAARFLAAALTAMGHKARFVSPEEIGLLVTTEYGNALPLPEGFKNLKKLKAKIKNNKDIIVFPGFYGITEGGRIATFSRGGSDLTGSLVAAAVQAEVYENFTDVQGIFCANPMYLDNVKPRKIERLTFQELRELSYSGFSVFHDEAILPVMTLKKPVPIHLRDFRYPEKRGTMIVGDRDHLRGHIIGIAAEKGFVSITVHKNLMNREIGFGRRLFQILEEKGLSYEHSPSGIDSISVVLKKHGLTAGLLKEIERELKSRLGVDSVKVEKGLAMIAIVGLGMKESIGTAARATRAFSKAGVNIEMISQGASEISIFFAVREKDVNAAVTSLYNRLIRKEKTPYLSEIYRS